MISPANYARWLRKPVWSLNEAVDLTIMVGSATPENERDLGVEDGGLRS
jgi:hypothetical protein